MDSESSTIPPSNHKSLIPETIPDIVCQMILLCLPNIGPSRYWQLCEMFGSAREVLATELKHFPKVISGSTTSIIKQLQNNAESHPLIIQAQNELIWCRENGINIVGLDDKYYPELLSKIHSPPPILYVKGDIENLSLPQLAVVGSRNPTPAGTDNAFYFSRELAKIGFAITSGLALGVDGAAHRGALEAGKTIAVLGTGIDKVYPQRHRQLAEDIIEKGGTIVSEFPLGVGPHASHFPRRNRIISGLSLGVLVVEAAIKSGSLITARFAMQHDREVFAIPGSIHNPLSRGNHSLIKEGATLVEQVSDLKESLDSLLEYKWSELIHRDDKQKEKITTDNLLERGDANTGCSDFTEPSDKSANLSKDESLILNAISYDETTFDTLAERTRFETGKLLSSLMALELKGIVLQTPTGYMKATTTKEIV